MSPTYRALFCDLRSDQVIDALPLTGLTFDDYIGKPGSLSGTIPVPNEELARRALKVVPARTALWLERDGDIWWGGIVWTATRTGPARGGPAGLEIQAATWDSYLDHRIVFETQTFTDRDQFDVVRDVVTWAQTQPGGHLDIVLDWSKPSGVRRDLRIDHHDLPRVGELLTRFAEMDDGFEWRMASYRDPTTGRRIKELQLGHPRIVGGSADIVLDFPGSVLSYSYPEDGTGRATHWQSRGASLNENQAEVSYPQMSELHTVPDGIGAGWPRLDSSSDHSTVENSVTLEAHAIADLNRAWTQHTIPEVTVRLDGRITPALLGARVRLRVRDVWYPGGFDRRYRVVGMSVTPPDRGQAETARLFLEEEVG
ncbi:hypothetical protein ACIBSV_14815 [Embleya sp. NPDC050154]|uniref:hypothetical protein n=1 Tax=Embleya sp. NPDC050154 TaxID=3363988 RepID=UPI0037926390